MQTRYYYLLKIQFLGYRLHGWQHQPNLKTVESLLKKTLKFILEKQNFKILGSSRTDAMVSAQEAAFELFLKEIPLDDLQGFLTDFNKNLPPDIRALEIKEVDAKFNIIQNAKKKEYAYLFAFGDKSHPFCAPLLTTIREELDINLMMEGAKLFEGTHFFKSYCSKPSGEGKYTRELLKCEITRNHLISASFFPRESFVLHVHGQGFLRNQVRLIMGSLIQLGRGEVDLEIIRTSLLPNNEIVMDYIAPASGLILNKVEISNN